MYGNPYVHLEWADTSCCKHFFFSLYLRCEFKFKFTTARNWHIIIDFHCFSFLVIKKVSVTQVPAAHCCWGD